MPRPLNSLRSVALVLTGGCNSKCESCDHWRSPRADMSEDVFLRVLEGLDRLPARRAHLTGGEPMQHPNWPSYAQRLRAKGCEVVLVTNGILLSKQLSDVVREVQDLRVSLDAADDASYRLIRGSKAFSLVLQGARQAARAGVPLSTRTTISRKNFRALSAIVERALECQASKVTFQAMDASPGLAFGRWRASSAEPALDPGLLIESRDMDALRESFREVEQRFASEIARGQVVWTQRQRDDLLAYFGAVAGDNAFPPPSCNIPDVSVIVERDGTMRSCFFLPSWGSLEGLPFDQLVNGEQALELRRQYRAGERAECVGCVCARQKS